MGDQQTHEFFRLNLGSIAGRHSDPISDTQPLVWICMFDAPKKFQNIFSQMVVMKNGDLPTM